MDTSETYIKMCDCLEIQKVQSFLGDEVDIFHDSQKGIHYGFPTASSIWLPRQDQLQDMTGLNLPEEFFRFIGKICEWILNDGSEWLLPDKIDEYYQQFTSMEQLWLAFFMQESHKKTWTGKAWLKD